MLFFKIIGFWGILGPSRNYAYDERPLVKGPITNFGIFLDFLSFFSSDDFFPFFKKKYGFLALLVHPTVVSVLLSALSTVCGIFFFILFLLLTKILFDCLCLVLLLLNQLQL